VPSTPAKKESETKAMRAESSSDDPRMRSGDFDRIMRRALSVPLEPRPKTTPKPQPKRP